MVASEGDDECAFGEGLTVDLVEAVGWFWKWSFLCFSIFYNRCRDGVDAFEMQYELEQGVDANDLDSREEQGFREVFRGDIDFGEASRFGGLNNIDSATDGADVAVQGELADKKFLVEIGDEEIA